MKRGLILLSVASLVFASVATASVQQGDTELDFLGGFMKQNGEGDTGDIEAFFLSAALGYFFTDNIQGQVAAMGLWAEVDDEDTDVYGIGIRGKYHFMPTNQWVPYVGGQLMWVDAEFADEDADGTLWGPLFGLRYELNTNNDFFAEYQYQMWEGDVGEDLDDGHLLVFGLIHQFK
jgi:hypothetical protein